MSDQRKIVIRRKIVPPLPEAPKATRKRQGFKKADIMRAMDAAKAAGLDVGMVELAPDGTIRLAAKSRMATSLPDDMFAKWEAKL